jgi:hypothetical protein
MRFLPLMTQKLTTSGDTYALGFNLFIAMKQSATLTFPWACVAPAT